ncbi:hypothetical protein [Aurantiacibacter sediminis]|uniref:Uncharacterized protein n=1 Tax=Aurantiacibacter sediminis TaxID=2793064 RepID=A0ABS0N1T2_9SPHN|nr:hypothetical protein [Aurantiacibacter sediminis]MBH5321923.1 hypothetical protein [Aurantiacibacter sediminis]
MNRRHFLASTGSAAITFGAAPSLALAQGGRDFAYDWEIGPVIRGRNYSVGMPPHPVVTRDGWYFDFPGPRRRDGHVHYITRPSGPLDRARGIRIRFRIDARRNTRFVPQEHPDLHATLSLYLQENGDDWSGRGRGEFSRWYSPTAALIELTPGAHEASIMFDENWISVMGSNRNRNPREFAAMLARVGTVGITFGSRQARGHGVFATAPARFELLDFAII